MKIKSLLLGSAAALIAATTAQAADAIIVEPEPMEYVKVCDMYGAGYFYIPGTETCLKIGGYIRVEYSATSFHDTADFVNEVSYHNSRIRTQMQFTAKNETEYGTLGSDIIFRLGNPGYGWLNEPGNNNAAVGHDTWSSSEGWVNGMTAVKATINMAGFRVGYDINAGSAWNRYGGYGYYSASQDGLYLFDTSMFFEYGGSAGGFNYVVGMQDSRLSGASGAPDLYAGMNTTMGGLALAAVVMYDSNGGYDTKPWRPTGDGGLAYRVRADYDLSSFIPGGSIGAWYEGDDGQTDYVKGHRWGVTMKASLTDKLGLYAGYSEFDSDSKAFSPAARAAGGLPADARDWTVGVKWDVASGLYILAEWNKRQCAETNCIVATQTSNSGNRVWTQDSADTFRLRIQRSF